MKKIIPIIILLALLIAGVLFLKPNQTNITENVAPITEEEPFEIVAPIPEIHVKSLESNSTYEITEEEVAYIKNENMIKLDYINDIYRFLYEDDQANNRLIMVYEDQTLLFDFTTNTYVLNGKETFENDILTKKVSTVYVSLDKLSSLFNISYFLIEDPLFSLKLDFNSNGENSYKIRDTMNQVKQSLPEKINMTWEAVYSRKTDVSKLYDMPGLNVISPVWYEVKDNTGKVTSKKQDDYIEWANSKGYDLWPAITNSFDSDLTHEVISDITIRTELIEKLVILYSDNKFAGINIDFENIYKADKNMLSQFIAELTAAFHRSGMLVSIDVTFGGGSDNWSKCYDRGILGQWVDFVVVMSYDEHWGSSPVSGSVASINWLDKNLAILTSEVDAQKVVMGIPFYMRVWFERPHKEQVNSMKVTSDAITMYKMESILASGDYTVLWDENAGQNYISFIDAGDNAVKKIWIEDAESLKIKLGMVHKYNLKGIASWRRGYELESIWPMLDEQLKK